MPILHKCNQFFIKILITWLISLFFPNANCNALAYTSGTIIWNNDSVSEALFPITYNAKHNCIPYWIYEKKIPYFNSDNQTFNKTLSPNDVKEVKFIFQGNEVRLLSISGLSKNSRIFLPLVVDGRVKLLNKYQINSTTVGGPNSNLSNERLIEKSIIMAESGIVQKISKSNYQKKLKHLLSDCGLVIAKIESKKYLYIHLKEIIFEYNSCLK